MSDSPYVTVREASQLLGISEGKVMQFIEGRRLQAYRIADQYLRLKRADVLSLKNSGDVKAENVKFPYTSHERLRDFFAYNDFYIASFVIILVLLGIIFFSN
ncbi:MAG: excisionase family DNA-binding protein [Candidatus Omnitrophica bacterium]|nr:excisionase family DNA-binding protein [Candidatus Omnitrophota bacterium]